MARTRSGIKCVNFAICYESTGSVSIRTNEMKNYAIIVHWSDEDAVWIAEASDLEPCAAHGDTPEQAAAELRVAMQAWIDVASENGLAIPEARYRPTTVAAE
jgi:predicted RNase H-like HicB family nuclease